MPSTNFNLVKMFIYQQSGWKILLLFYFQLLFKVSFECEINIMVKFFVQFLVTIMYCKKLLQF